jgi:hypothetical protein
MKEKRVFHHKPHKTGTKSYRGKTKECEEKDANLAEE